jgi:glycerophosphoryl diester phosphodiesterase
MKFIAHRGYSKRFPENSLQAFTAVLQHPRNGRSLIGIELDIHLTSDNRIPVMHETAVGIDGRSVPVSAMTFAQLQQYASVNLHHAIPDLDATLELVNHATILNLELKEGSYDHDRFMALLIETLERYAPCGDIIISSFSVPLLAMTMNVTGHLNLRYGFLLKTWSAWNEVGADVAGRLDYLHPWYRLLLEGPVPASLPDLPLLCWTTDDPVEVQSLLALDTAHRIRAIMTNDITLSERFGDC